LFLIWLPGKQAVLVCEPVHLIRARHFAEDSVSIFRKECGYVSLVEITVSHEYMPVALCAVFMYVRFCQKPLRVQRYNNFLRYASFFGEKELMNERMKG